MIWTNLSLSCTNLFVSVHENQKCTLCAKSAQVFGKKHLLLFREKL